MVVIANSFLFWRIRSLFLRLRSLKLRPPYSTSIKKSPSPFHNKKVSSRTGGIAQSYLYRKSVRSGSNFYSKFRLNSITWRGGVGGLFERMFFISIKRVSSHFPESQSYSSTLAKLMMKEDLDLSADDDDVHSWLDALNERALSRLRKNFLRN